MSDPIEDGGPAFPVSIYDGMSLRDYFAAAALPKIIEEAHFYERKVCVEDVKSEGISWYELNSSTDADMMSQKAEQVAFACYNFADAMLAARKE